jgi:hypothetical protein
MAIAGCGGPVRATRKPIRFCGPHGLLSVVQRKITEEQQDGSPMTTVQQKRKTGMNKTFPLGTPYRRRAGAVAAMAGDDLILQRAYKRKGSGKTGFVFYCAPVETVESLYSRPGPHHSMCEVMLTGIRPCGLFADLEYYADQLVSPREVLQLAHRFMCAAQKVLQQLTDVDVSLNCWVVDDTSRWKDQKYKVSIHLRNRRFATTPDMQVVFWDRVVEQLEFPQDKEAVDWSVYTKFRVIRTAFTPKWDDPTGTVPRIIWPARSVSVTETLLSLVSRDATPLIFAEEDRLKVRPKGRKRVTRTPKRPRREAKEQVAVEPDVQHKAQWQAHARRIRQYAQRWFQQDAFAVHPDADSLRAFYVRCLQEKERPCVIDGRHTHRRNGYRVFVKRQCYMMTNMSDQCTSVLVLGPVMDWPEADLRDIAVEHIHQQWVRPFSLSAEAPTVHCVSAGMGSGKTTAVFNLIKSLPFTGRAAQGDLQGDLHDTQGPKVLIVTPRRTLAAQMHAQLKPYGFQHYFGIKADLTQGNKLALVSRVIITPESLHKLQFTLPGAPFSRVHHTYDLVYLDEFSLITTGFSTDATHKCHYLNNLELLRTFVRSGTKVIVTCADFLHLPVNTEFIRHLAAGRPLSLDVYLPALNLRQLCLQEGPSSTYNEQLGQAIRTGRVFVACSTVAQSHGVLQVAQGVQGCNIMHSLHDALEDFGAARAREELDLEVLLDQPEQLDQRQTLPTQTLPAPQVPDGVRLSSYDDICQHFSPDDLPAALRTYGRIYVYNSMTGQAGLKHFQDVNAAWSSQMLISATSTAAVGISFDLPDMFSQVFMFKSSQGAGARTMLQLMLRIRRPTRTEVPVYIGATPVANVGPAAKKRKISAAPPVSFDSKLEHVTSSFGTNGRAWASLAAQPVGADTLQMVARLRAWSDFEQELDSKNQVAMMVRAASRHGFKTLWQPLEEQEQQTCVESPESRQLNLSGGLAGLAYEELDNIIRVRGKEDLISRHIKSTATGAENAAATFLMLSEPWEGTDLLKQIHEHHCTEAFLRVVKYSGAQIFCWACLLRLRSVQLRPRDQVLAEHGQARLFGAPESVVILAAERLLQILSLSPTELVTGTRVIPDAQWNHPSGHAAISVALKLANVPYRGRGPSHFPRLCAVLKRLLGLKLSRRYKGDKSALLELPPVEMGFPNGQTMNMAQLAHMSILCTERMGTLVECPHFKNSIDTK